MPITAKSSPPVGAPFYAFSSRRQVYNINRSDSDQNPLFPVFEKPIYDPPLLAKEVYNIPLAATSYDLTHVKDDPMISDVVVETYDPSTFSLPPTSSGYDIVNVTMEGSSKEGKNSNKKSKDKDKKKDKGKNSNKKSKDKDKKKHNDKHSNKKSKDKENKDHDIQTKKSKPSPENLLKAEVKVVVKQEQMIVKIRDAKLAFWKGRKDRLKQEKPRQEVKKGLEKLKRKESTKELSRKREFQAQMDRYLEAHPSSTNCERQQQFLAVQKLELKYWHKALRKEEKKQKQKF